MQAELTGMCCTVQLKQLATKHSPKDLPYTAQLNPACEAQSQSLSHMVQLTESPRGATRRSVPYAVAPEPLQYYAQRPASHGAVRSRFRAQPGSLSHTILQDTTQGSASYGVVQHYLKRSL